MKLASINNFFNWGNAPWPVVARPSVYGEWTPPGQAFSSCVLNLVINPPTTLERPKHLILQSCQSVSEGSMDVLMYAFNPADTSAYGRYPWEKASCIQLVIAHVADTAGHAKHTWAECPVARVDDLAAMKISHGICFGVACKSMDGGIMRWHSARMLASY